MRPGGKYHHHLHVPVSATFFSVLCFSKKLRDFDNLSRICHTLDNSPELINHNTITLTSKNAEVSNRSGSSKKGAAFSLKSKSLAQNAALAAEKAGIARPQQHQQREITPSMCLPSVSHVLCSFSLFDCTCCACHSRVESLSVVALVIAETPLRELNFGTPIGSTTPQTTIKCAGTEPPIVSGEVMGTREVVTLLKQQRHLALEQINQGQLDSETGVIKHFTSEEEFTNAYTRIIKDVREGNAIGNNVSSSCAQMYEETTPGLAFFNQIWEDWYD